MTITSIIIREIPTLCSALQLQANLTMDTSHDYNALISQSTQVTTNTGNGIKRQIN